MNPLFEAKRTESVDSSSNIEQARIQVSNLIHIKTIYIKRLKNDLLRSRIFEKDRKIFSKLFFNFQNNNYFRIDFRIFVTVEVNEGYG